MWVSSVFTVTFFSSGFGGFGPGPYAGGYSYGAGNYGYGGFGPVPYAGGYGYGNGYGLF